MRPANRGTMKALNVLQKVSLAIVILGTTLPGFPATADTVKENCAPEEEMSDDAEMLVIPHDDFGNGDSRSEMLAAAVRLHGISNSFSPDQFISHVLYVTGLADRDMFPMKSWAESLTRKLHKAGVLKTKMSPAPGDLVFFSLSSGAAHSPRASKVTVGVVEKVRSGRLNFILAGSSRVIRGTLKTGKGKFKETTLTKCTGKVPASKKDKSGKSAKSSKKKSSKKAKKSVTKSVPCKASELLIGFADIEDVALALNPLPPSPPTLPRPRPPVLPDEDTREPGVE